MRNKIYALLSSLGITANYTGFFYITDALLLSVSDTDHLLLVTKRLYPDLAKRYHTSAKNIERSIRTAINIAWNNNPELLMQIAKNKLPSKPTATEFLAILTVSLITSE